MTRSLIPAVVVLFTASVAGAQTLSEATARLAEAQRQYRTCRDGKLQLEFSPVLLRLEASRKSLERGRRQFEAARRSLETTRKRIEAGHDVRHLSQAEREAKEQQYLQSLATSYTARIQALRPLNASYVEGINRYAEVFEQYSSFCAKGGITDASARSLVASLQPAVAQLEGNAKDLVVSAGKVTAGDMATR